MTMIEPEKSRTTGQGSAGVKAILKAELKRRGLTYADLVERLAEQGVIETEANLRNKISRGAFTASFFVQCLIAVGCDQIQLNVQPRSTPTGQPQRKWSGGSIK